MLSATHWLQTASTGVGVATTPNTVPQDLHVRPVACLSSMVVPFLGLHLLQSTQRGLRYAHRQDAERHCASGCLGPCLARTNPLASAREFQSKAIDLWACLFRLDPGLLTDHI